jgi:hypothetical protein
MRWVWPLLIVVALVFGAAYASVIVSAMILPISTTAIEHDGRATNIEISQNLPRPDWVPVYPNASIVQASKVTPAQAPSGFHGLDLATRASLDEVKRFYTERLTAAGFAVSDQGLMGLNPMTARMLGMDGTISGKRAATDDLIYIHVRTADGLIPSRLLQIHWAKISEYPRHAEQFP